MYFNLYAILYTLLKSTAKFGKRGRFTNSHVPVSVQVLGHVSLISQHQSDNNCFSHPYTKITHHIMLAKNGKNETQNCYLRPYPICSNMSCSGKHSYLKLSKNEMPLAEAMNLQTCGLSFNYCLFCILASLSPPPNYLILSFYLEN